MLRALENLNILALLLLRIVSVLSLATGGMALVRYLFLIFSVTTFLSFFVPTDRGNGFEKKLFESKNAKRRIVAESYQWSVDDM